MCPFCGITLNNKVITKNSKNNYLRVCLIVGVILVFFVSIINGTNSNTNKNDTETNQQVKQLSEYNIQIAPVSVVNNFKDSVLNKGYAIKGNIYQTKSKDFMSVYIFGALIEKNGQIYNCLWANNKPDASGIFDSINDYAKNVSGILISGNIKTTDDGYSRINQKLLDDWNKL